VLADAHADLLLELAYREHRLQETDVFGATWLPLLEAGGVGLQVCPVFVELELQPEGSLREALRQASALHRAAREHPERVVVVRTADDLDAVEREERIGLLLALEGVEPFGYEVGTADVFWELGLRMAGLTWNRRNPFADGAAEDGGLSRLGRALLARFAELGMILDLSHASERLFAECLEAYEGRLLVTHAGCRAVTDTPRNLSDAQLRALAARDGVFGLMLHPLAIDPERPTIERAVDHLDHAAALIGAERLCLAGDWTKRLHELMPAPAPPDGLMPPGLAEGTTIDGLAGPEDYPRLVEALRTRGWEGERLEGLLSRNLLRFLRESLPDRPGSGPPRNRDHACRRRVRDA
jgi:membrane dipeptidase